MTANSTFTYLCEGSTKRFGAFVSLQRADGKIVSVKPEKFAELKAAGKITSYRVLNTDPRH
ncbi:hypothetical protein [Hyphomicrobium sp.]|uniref:hypothetical protein n=1 Tax=Hyphomicrobium sp. TaxID=82 RepID=UPI001D2CE05A|nr:hypothetical protein [Hyphomicrobium sp.]MBY0561542.1 hypothetical protein [Hyphomicrobium sp.]